MSYTPNNPNGQAAAASSAPVTLSTEDVQDVYITGAASQSASGNNLLLASAGTSAIDCMPANGPTYRSFSCQINGSAGISAGAVTFEGSNDNTTFYAILNYDDAAANGALATSRTILASANKFFSGKIAYRYLRCRISTGFTGGTVQAFTKLSFAELTSQLTVAQNSGALLTTSLPTATASSYSLTTTASTNAASVKASAGSLYEIAISNPTATAAYVKLYNKASAPTVGTDVPVCTIPAPANSFVAYPFTFLGKRFTTGIAIAVTAAITDADTAVAVAGVHIHGTYL